jgi:hypothetical protein
MRSINSGLGCKLHLAASMANFAFCAKAAFLLLPALVILGCAGRANAQSASSTGADEVPSGVPDAPPVAALPGAIAPVPGVHWRSLFLQSFEFLIIEHGFRYATEEGTRHPHRPFFRGHADSLENLHGWPMATHFPPIMWATQCRAPFQASCSSRTTATIRARSSAGTASTGRAG